MQVWKLLWFVSGWTVEDSGMHFLHSISYGFIMKFSFKLDIGMDHVTWLNEIFMKSHKACNLPKGLALSIECMQMTCADNCTEDMYRWVQKNESFSHWITSMSFSVRAVRIARKNDAWKRANQEKAKVENTLHAKQLEELLDKSLLLF